MNDNRKQQEFFKKAYDLGSQRVPSGYGWPMEIDPQQLKFLNIVKQSTSSGNALDIGCGQGRHTFMLAENGFDAYGIDFLERPVVEAQDKAKNEKLQNIHFKVMDVLDLDFPDNFFEVILDWSVVDHIYPKDWAKYFENINRVLKKDGFLILTEFSVRDKKITDPSKNYSDGANYDHFFREDEIENLFKEKFNILKVKHNELNTTSHFAMINVLLQKVRS